MVFFHNFYQQKQIDKSTLLLSMNSFPLVIWLLILNISIFLSAGFLGSSQEKIQTLSNTQMTLESLLNYTPITVIVIFFVLSFDLFIILYRIDICVTNSEVIVRHKVRKFTFYASHYPKSNFTLHIVTLHDIDLFQIPLENSTLSQVKLKSFGTSLTLISFKKNKMQETKDYVFKLEHHGIHLDKNVMELFQINNKSHHKHEKKNS